MEAVTVNVRQTIAMYWEADRSVVKARYDALFPKRNGEDSPAPADSGAAPSAEEDPPHHSPPSKDWETRWDTEFRDAVKGMGFSDRIVREFLERWDALEGDWRLVALHHFLTANDAGWSVPYTLEGLINDFGVWAATHALHSIVPETQFPIDIDLTYRRLKLILRILGITYGDGDELLPVDVATNISGAVAEFNKRNGWEPWQTWAMVYDLGPRLLPDPAPYPTDAPPKVWVISANKPSGDFEECDGHLNSEVYSWCINSKAKRGDIALMYHLAPRSAIVGLYRCYSDAYADPLRPSWWTGGRGELTDRIAIPWITMKEMKQDPILKDWGLVKRNFVGMLQLEVLPDAWNRIKELVASKDPDVGRFLDRYATSAGGVHSIAAIGEDISEEAVEDTLVLPLLQALGWDIRVNLSRQHEMDIKIGSGKPKRVRADFVGFRDALGSEALMVVETKCGIRNDTELTSAVEQCESYAGKLRCPRFAVAAPEGLWIYQMNFPGNSIQLAHVPLQRQVSPITMQKIMPLLGFCSLQPAK